MIYADRELAKKLERTEARANAACVVSRSLVQPDSRAEWIEVGGAYAMFDGLGSPLTQTFGLGIFKDATETTFETIERFFCERGSDVFHEISPMADPALITLLNGRGYKPCELSTVLYKALDGDTVIAENRPTSVTTHVIRKDEVDVWAATSAKAWASAMPELADFMLDFGTIGAKADGSFPFIAELDGHAIATGGLFIYDDIALLAGASTLVEHRHLGAQSRLLFDRLAFARSNGCTLAMMVAAPGSQSQGNSQKNGFAVAYTRTKWQLAIDKLASSISLD